VKTPIELSVRYAHRKSPLTLDLDNMKKYICIIFLISLVFSALANSTNEPSLIGAWESIENPNDEEKLTFHFDEQTLVVNRGRNEPWKYKVDYSKQPIWVDIEKSDGTYYCIVEFLDADSFRMIGNTNRPVSFEKSDEVLKLKRNNSLEKPKEIVVPKDLEDCFVHLHKLLDKELIEQMKTGTQDDMIQYHFGLGMWIRNNWGLWGGSRLSEWFNKKGITHPDDMSGIILDSFWKHLNNQPIDWEEKLKEEKTESNQELQPTVTTPVKSGNEHGTAAEL